MCSLLCCPPLCSFSSAVHVDCEVDNSMFSASAAFTCGLASATIWSHSSADKKLWYTYARGCFEICSALHPVQQVYEARLELLCPTLLPLLTILVSALGPSVLRSVHKSAGKFHHHPRAFTTESNWKLTVNTHQILLEGVFSQGVEPPCMSMYLFLDEEQHPNDTRMLYRLRLEQTP